LKEGIKYRDDLEINVREQKYLFKM